MNFALMIVLKSTVLLACAALLSIVCRRGSAATRHAVWALAILSSLALPLASSLLPQIDLPLLPEVTVTLLPNSLPETGPPDEPLKNYGRAIPLDATHMGMIWAAGFLLVVARFLLASRSVWRLSKHSIRANGDGWGQLIDEMRHRLSIAKPVRLLIHDGAISPMTWGVFRHFVLLPAAANQWTGARRRLVLAHELAHVKRNDGVMQALVQLATSVYWFNPLLWYAAHRLRVERERACDDHVLNLGANPEDYAGHLLQIARGLRHDAAFSYAAVSMAQPSQLETRLVSILDSRISRRSLSRPAASSLFTTIALLTALLGVAGVTAAVPVPPILPVTVITTKLMLERPAAEPAPKPATAQRTRIGNAGTIANVAVTPPQIITSSHPSYTPEARAGGIEGIATLELAVDVQGNIQVLRVVKGLGYGLDEQAIAAVQSWRFAPASRNGVPVAAITQVDVEFNLADAGPFKIGPDVTPPRVVYRVEPQYTEEARSQRYTGTVVLAATINADGTVTIDRVIQALDHGLTEKAIEALTQWKFAPGTRNGKAVAVSLNIEVNFNFR